MDGVSVKGLIQSQVIELLRKAKEKVVLVISRQEYVESQDEVRMRVKTIIHKRIFNNETKYH